MKFDILISENLFDEDEPFVIFRLVTESDAKQLQRISLKYNREILIRPNEEGV